MSRLTPYVLLIGFSIAGFRGAGDASAAAPSAASALALRADDQEKETARYNRKLEKLAEKRVKDQQKLEADYRKLFQGKKGMDLQKLQKKLDEIRRKRDKQEEKYRKELLKIEREWQEKYEKADN